MEIDKRAVNAAAKIHLETVKSWNTITKPNCLVLLGFTGFYLVLPGFHLVLPRFTEFYLVLPSYHVLPTCARGLTECYRVEISGSCKWAFSRRVYTEFHRTDDVKYGRMKTMGWGGGPLGGGAVG